MDELAIVRADAGELLAAECNEPVAVINFNRKKMLQLEQGIGGLQKAARQHNEVVAQLENSMKAMISETDLLRSMGLAFQEFEHRLEDAFQDSNRKCLAMFSRRDDTVELQGQISKKVSWAEFNNVMKKLADLRQYIDTMADSVFIGHRDALNGEFAKKADKNTVDEAMRSKADNDSVNEVRARLERLEVLVSYTDTRQSGALEAMRDDLASKSGEAMDKAQALIKANFDQITDLKAEKAALMTRLSSAESEISSLDAASSKLREVQLVLKAGQDDVILPRAAAMQEQLDRLEVDAGRLHQDLQTLAADASDLRQSSQSTAKGLSAIVNSNKEHVDFLLQETDMIKRRAKELAKKQATGFKEAGDEQEKFSQQLQAIERDVKRQGRDVRAIEHRSAKEAVPSALEGLRALPASLPSALALLPPEGDAAERMRSMMEQLEQLAFGGPSYEPFAVPFNPDRPPLPTSGKQSGDMDLSRLPRFSSNDPAPIDSARGGGSMYGLSPRVQVGRSSSRKKR